MGSLITTSGKGIILDRTFLAVPTKTAMSQFKVGTGTTEPALADTDIETGVNINGGAFKDFVNGFPTLDTVNNEATTRMFLNSLEANGNDLTEMASFNADGSPVMFSRVVFTVVSKTTSNEVTFIQKDRMV